MNSVREETELTINEMDAMVDHDSTVESKLEDENMTPEYRALRQQAWDDFGLNSDSVTHTAAIITCLLRDRKFIHDKQLDAIVASTVDGLWALKGLRVEGGKLVRINQPSPGPTFGTPQQDDGGDQPSLPRATSGATELLGDEETHNENNM